MEQPKWNRMIVAQEKHIDKLFKSDVSCFVEFELYSHLQILWRLSPKQRTKIMFLLYVDLIRLLSCIYHDQADGADEQDRVISLTL